MKGFKKPLQILEHIFPLGDFSLDMALFTNFAIAFAASDCNASSLSRHASSLSRSLSRSLLSLESPSNT